MCWKQEIDGSRQKKLWNLTTSAGNLVNETKTPVQKAARVADCLKYRALRKRIYEKGNKIKKI